MARQQIKNYVFTPGGAGVGTVKIPGNYEISDILTILNATDQVFIYNFADPDLGGTVSFTSGTDADFPTTEDGVTTITLTATTALMSASDTLAVYIETESQYIRPWPFGTDAVERMRVANPQSLIDADFEYGLQNTKWQSIALNNDVPSIYELPGSEFRIGSAGYVTTFGSGAISSSGDTSVTLANQSGTLAPNWEDDDYALIVNPYVAGGTLTATIAEDAVASNQSTIVVDDTTDFAEGDQLVLVQLPASDQTTVATGITSGATTSLVLTSGSGFATGQLIMVETNNADIWEVMTVTNVVSNTLTVVRRQMASNSGNVNLNSGNSVRIVSNIEIARVQTVSSATNLKLDRGWMNTTPVRNMITGSHVMKLNIDPGTQSGANVEIIQMTTVGTTVANTATIARGQLGTTAVSSAPTGTVVVRLTGFFQAGNEEVNQVAIRIPEHGLNGNTFISTTNHRNSNTEGLYKVLSSNTNYITYYPRKLTGEVIGHQLNQTDSQIRQAAAFDGATLPLTSIVSDAGTPSTITVTTPYDHGLSPGTPILVDITNSPTNKEYAEGSFTVLSIPTPTTFTFQCKSGAAVSGAITADVWIRPSAFFIHRPFDGGVLIGSGTPHRGAMAGRQSKKYFRYQSGKGLVWTSGTLLSTNFDVADIEADGTAALTSTISLHTDVEHYLQIGANIKLSGVTTSGYNNYYRVSSILSDTSFTVTAQETLGNATPVIGNQPKINLIGWHGGAVRAGIFDEQNGAFWENNGTNINVVLRSATFQLAGTLSMEVGSSLVTGDGSCRFLEQLVKYDRVVIRGMSHTVTHIVDNNTMIVSPAWRGLSNQTRVKASRVIDRRVKQADFNLDRVDGTGPSGYVLDASKMQMLLVQYTWYGAGFVDFGLRGPLGNYIMVHRFMNNNVNNEAYMRSGNLPVRYSANNEGPTSRLAAGILAGATSLTVEDGIQYPPASVAYPFYVSVENEVIKVQGHTAGSNTFTNLTRAATFTLWQDGQSRSFSQGIAADHAEGVGVTLLDATCAPTLNHWGSAVIMDGGFDQDRGYAFTFNRQNLALPTTAGEKSTVFLMRLAPAVSNTIIGDLGDRDLLNRAQLILENMIVNVTGGRFVIEGILNPNNIDGSSIEWIDLNTEINGNQPSFTQFATAFGFTGDTTGGLVGADRYQVGGLSRTGLCPSSFTRLIRNAVVGTGAVTTSGSGTAANLTLYKYSGTSVVSNDNTYVTVNDLGTGFAVGDTITLPGNLWVSTSGSSAGGSTPTHDVTLTIVSVAAGVQGGERLFAIPISETNSGLLDLSKVKQLVNSAIPGNGVYPNGPEVLAINITAAAPGSSANGEFQITFSETQA